MVDDSYLETFLLYGSWGFGTSLSYGRPEPIQGRFTGRRRLGALQVFSRSRFIFQGYGELKPTRIYEL